MNILEQELANLKLGDHACLLYDTDAEALDVVAPYIDDGLARREQCLVIWRPPVLDQVAAVLAARGVGVSREQARGALLLWPAFDSRLPSGQLDPRELIAFVRTLTQQAVAAGFTGLHLIADMPWTVGMAIDLDKLVIYEALWNDLMATDSIQAICMYLRHTIAPELLRGALRTHPLALLGGHLCPNLYYEPPSLVVDADAVAQRVDWMINQLLRSHLIEESLRDAEARYRSIFERTSDGLIILDLDGRIVEANPALCRMHGYRLEELVGRPVTMLIHPDYHPTVAASFRLVANDGEFSADLVDLRKDGTSLHVELYGISLTARHPPYLLWVVRDISAHVAAQQLLEQRVAERTRELTTLLQVAGDVASTLEMEPLLELILGQLSNVVDYTAASIRALQGNDLVGLAYRGPVARDQMVGQVGLGTGYNMVGQEILRRGTPVIIDDVRGNTPMAHAFQEGAGDLLSTTFSYIRSWLGVPLLLKERVLGMLALSHQQPGFYTQHHADLAMAMASHIAVAIENARLYQQVREAAISEERARIARELHDSLAQMLFYVNTQAEAALTLVQTDQIGLATEQLKQLAQAARDGYADVREGILALRSAGESHGLLEALTTYLPLWTEQSGVRADLLVDPSGAPLPALAAAAEIQLVRIVQEALANVRKHAQASRVQIRVSATNGQISVVVEDDGVGFVPRERGPGASSHFGLATMRERAAAVGGRLEIDSRPGQGTRVIAHVPVQVDRLDPERNT